MKFVLPRILGQSFPRIALNHMVLASADHLTCLDTFRIFDPVWASSWRIRTGIWNMTHWFAIRGVQKGHASYVGAMKCLTRCTTPDACMNFYVTSNAFTRFQFDILSVGRWAGLLSTRTTFFKIECCDPSLRKVSKYSGVKKRMSKSTYEVW